MKTNKGFTLIELLIVIAIIGILATALLPTILNAPGKARDSARMLNISGIITAIEAYNADEGQYPQTDGCVSTSTGPFKDIAGDYFSGSNIPQDPSGLRTSLTGTDAVTTCAKAGQYYYKYLGDANGQYLVG
ncbi:type II secretion system GspH family protein, partial [Patescibacteria group bacterium]|nr:type II secretion system GspH family protein [Patescibacteria group bacterium]